MRKVVQLLQQEKLRGRRERDRQRRAEEIAEQREDRLAIDAERQIEQVGNYTYYRGETRTPGLGQS